MSENKKESNNEIPSTVEIEIDVEKYINLFKIKLKKFFIVLIKLFIIFIGINLLIFTPLVLSVLKDPEYPKQKALLISANKINRLYIFPLSKKFGYKSKITIPFYNLRDKLYYKGIAMLPENSPEKEVWWYNTRFIEYAGLVVPKIYELFDIDKRVATDEDIKDFNDWFDEVYDHIKNFPNVDMSQTIYRNDVLFIYRDMINKYVKGSSILSRTLQITEPFYLENIRPIRGNNKKLAAVELPEEWKHINKNRGRYPGPKYEAIQHNIEFIENFDKFKEKLKSQNSEAYRTYEQAPIIKEYVVKMNVLHEFLSYQDTFEKISCNSNELIEFVNYRTKIIEYIINHPNISAAERLRYQFELIYSFDIPKECVEISSKSKKARQKLTEFFYNQRQEYLKENQNKK